MSIIKAIRSLELINKVLFTKEQRLLLKFQNKDVIVSTSEDSDMSNNAHNIIHEIHHKNEKVRNRFKENFESILDNYQTKSFFQIFLFCRELKNIDKKIIKGVVERKIGVTNTENQLNSKPKLTIIYIL